MSESKANNKTDSPTHNMEDKPPAAPKGVAEAASETCQTETDIKEATTDKQEKQEDNNMAAPAPTPPPIATTATTKNTETRQSTSSGGFNSKEWVELLKQGSAGKSEGTATLDGATGTSQRHSSLFQSAEFFEFLKSQQMASIDSAAGAESSSTKQGDNSKPKPSVFDSKDFVDFLKNQNIANLAFMTKDGALFSASFQPTASVDPSSLFQSVDANNGNLGGLYSTNQKGAITAQPPNIATRTCSVDSVVTSACTSKDWMSEYMTSHIDVSINRSLFQSQNVNAAKENPFSSAAAVATVAAAACPNKRASQGGGKTDWDSMYSNMVSAPLGDLVEAAARAQPIEAEGTTSGTMGKPNSGGNSNSRSKLESKNQQNKSQSKRKPRKVIPEVKSFVDKYTSADVLLGRGGRSNHHPGNKLYRSVVIENQAHYRGCEKSEKTKIAQGIVDSIKERHGGRFLELDKETNRWYVVPNIVARRKVGQALREDNTEEVRAAKRQRYKKDDNSSIGANSSSIGASVQ